MEKSNLVCKSTEHMISEVKELLQDNPNFNQLSIATEILSSALRIEIKLKQIRSTEEWEKAKAQHNG